MHTEPLGFPGGPPTLFIARADDHIARRTIFRKTTCSYLPCRGHFARIRSAPPASSFSLARAIGHENCSMSRVVAQMNRKGWVCLGAGRNRLGPCGVRDAYEIKDVIDTSSDPFGDGMLPGSREEGRAASSRRLEFTSSPCVLTAQLRNIARRRSQEKPDQIYRRLSRARQEGIQDPVRVVPRRKRRRERRLGQRNVIDIA